VSLPGLWCVVLARARSFSNIQQTTVGNTWPTNQLPFTDTFLLGDHLLAGRGRFWLVQFMNQHLAPYFQHSPNEGSLRRPSIENCDYMVPEVHSHSPRIWLMMVATQLPEFTISSGGLSLARRMLVSRLDASSDDQRCWWRDIFSQPNIQDYPNDSRLRCPLAVCVV